MKPQNGHFLTKAINQLASGVILQTPNHAIMWVQGEAPIYNSEVGEHNYVNSMVYGRYK